LNKQTPGRAPAWIGAYNTDQEDIVSHTPVDGSAIASVRKAGLEDFDWVVSVASEAFLCIGGWCPRPSEVKLFARSV
jgi:hypothetical protein